MDPFLPPFVAFNEHSIPSGQLAPVRRCLQDSRGNW